MSLRVEDVPIVPNLGVVVDEPEPGARTEERIQDGLQHERVDLRRPRKNWMLKWKTTSRKVAKIRVETQQRLVRTRTSLKLKL